VPSRSSRSRAERGLKGCAGTELRERDYELAVALTTAGCTSSELSTMTVSRSCRIETESSGKIRRHAGFDQGRKSEPCGHFANMLSGLTTAPNGTGTEMTVRSARELGGLKQTPTSARPSRTLSTTCRER